MSFEVDVLGVGQESKSGDAVAIRYGDFSHRDGFRVIVIDGGFQESGEELVNHVQRWYGTKRVDLQILTHPDADHVNGAHVVMEKMDVRCLWMHLPWNHAAGNRAYSQSSVRGGITNAKLKAALEGAENLEKLARSKGVPIVEPFAGLQTADLNLTVLGPSEYYYNELVQEFLEEKQAAGMAYSGLLEQILGGARKVAKWMSEKWYADTLTEPEAGAVSPQNNSSVVLLACLDHKYFLFTGDAGVPALTLAATYGESRGMNFPRDLAYFQSPHHGSKRNVGPTILNRLIGPIVPEGTPETRNAFISAAKEGAPKHPSRRVVNALIRRAARVSVTRGSTHCFSSDVPTRKGWSAVTPEKFLPEYEEEE
jgi:beta-lactamase superfamily II metal-dependent hydrolase